jgi:FkbM family methyltransferase
MILNTNDTGLSRTLLFFGTREKDHMYILKKELKDKDVVLDLGANIGYYVLMEAELVGTSGYIYAIEPVPSNVELLKRNIALNNREDMVEVFLMGGSNKTGIEKIYISEKSNLSTFYPVNYFKSSNVTSKDSPTIDVHTTTIPDFAAGKRPFDFIRMDVEGYEVEIFEGMLPMLEDRNFRPNILFETHRPKYHEKHHNMRNVLNRMFNYGYYPKVMVSNEHPKGEFISRGYQPEKLIHTDGYLRGIYTGISNEDALDFICDIGFVRAVLLERR